VSFTVEADTFVNISGATVTGSGSDGVFIDGRTVTVDSLAMARYETTYELWYEVRVWCMDTLLPIKAAKATMGPQEPYPRLQRISR
jgi:hypothetical protein